MSQPVPLSTDAAIRQRKTTKVLSQQDLSTKDFRHTLLELLQLAGMAPFHRGCDEVHRQQGLSGIEPWRFHVADATSCRRLGKQIPLENAGKIPAMLSAADALVLATWLPNPPAPGEVAGGADAFAPTLANMEHIAAAAAAIQNLLLAATARGIANYWSSGGVLRSREVFAQLNIPAQEILLGAIFLFPEETAGAEVVGSKLRGLRHPPSAWFRWIELS